MKYWDGEDWFFATFIAALFITLVAVVTLAVADGVTTGEGTVVNKYYDDPDLICSKGCFRTSECWTIVVDSEPWWNSKSCVSESEYKSIDIGDHFRE